MMKIQVWSHADKEYLMPVLESYKAKPREITYPRVSIAAVFNGKQTLFGMAIQHLEDQDNKEIGRETAVVNALINPVMVLNSYQEVGPANFQGFAWSLYHSVSKKLKPVSSRECAPERVYEQVPEGFDDEWVLDSATRYVLPGPACSDPSVDRITYVD